MKTKHLGRITTLAFVVIIGLNVKLNYEGDSISNLDLSNVEALAQGETSNCVYSSKKECSYTWHEYMPLTAGICAIFEFTESETYCDGYGQGSICCTYKFSTTVDHVGFSY